ncbi:putative O-glycosylation ligase, exosortase A system-associated [Catenovulum adriaticum]|uniref:O-glycosylation ligase, exosortase A system-associated n=1 Tax=Catenovulum adriaticum TaxID=2984846 RepID=A0ABY7ANH1_9ALTE|nr:putative O-glycosylation ligase, exosortase A system-associated [Catenovulum sp. TS8]WAJ70686.1 putative O-glycosylation ligase, exosortase A system-associated [Catenovulum sp. TS8]
MRDIVLVSCFFIILYFSFKRPFIGVSMWLWVSMFFPNGWVYGFGRSFRYSLMVAGVAILGYFLHEKDKIDYSKSIMVVAFIFLCWTFLSSLLTINYGFIVWPEFTKFFKVFLLFVFIQLIFKRQLHFETMAWALIFSVSFYGVTEGLKFISSFGNHIIKGLGGHILQDRNYLALAMNMVLPFLFYFIRKPGLHPQLKLILIGIFACNVIAILGSYSRSGLIGLIVIFFMLTRYSKQRVKILVVTSIIVITAIQFLPDAWFDRMNTIESAAQDDASFLGRVAAWKVSAAIAFDNPLLGGGFKAVENYDIWLEKMYKYSGGFLGEIDDYGYAKAAHSLYFQLLGDHGFGGLFIYLFLLFVTYLKLRKVIKSHDKNEWPRQYAEMMMISFAVYVVAGSTISVAVTDHPFAMFAMASCLPIKPKQNKQNIYSAH